MKLTQAEIEATVKEVLDNDCDNLRPSDAACCVVGGICQSCHRYDPLARAIANALGLKYLEKYRFVRPREATDSVTGEQALAGLKVTDGMAKRTEKR